MMQHMHLLGTVALLEVDLKNKIGGSEVGKNKNVERNFDLGNLQICRDFFWPSEQFRDDNPTMKGPTYSKDQFELRFLVSKYVFRKLFLKIVGSSMYFKKGLKPEYGGKIGLSSLQKVVEALRQLTYGTAADSFDEYVRISETSVLESLKHFCKQLVQEFEKDYLHITSGEELKNIEKKFAGIGFPGCMG